MKANILIHNSLVNANFKTVVALPDSQSSPLLKHIIQEKKMSYIQCSHESDCVGISTGLNLCNELTLTIMESSGLRNACETLARFHLSHSLYNIYLIANRGAFGERNWWGQAHSATMEPLLELLRFRFVYLNDANDIPKVINKSVNDFLARQSSIAIVINPDLLKDI